MILLRLVVFGVVLLGAVAFAPVQFCLRVLGQVSIADRLQVLAARLLCLALGLQVHRRGMPSGGALIVANHVSWTDILALGSCAPLCFLAKSEVATWPLLGAVVRAHGTLFVARRRTRQLPEVNRLMAQEMRRGRSVVLFAEGTTGNGTRLQKFNSGHVGAVRDLLSAAPDLPHVPVVPVALAYTAYRGLPAGYSDRTRLAWMGDASLLPHLLWLLRQGPIRCDLEFGEPILAGRDHDRKLVASEARWRVHRSFSSLVTGRGVASANNAVFAEPSAIRSTTMTPVLRPELPSGLLS